jgi:flagellar biosynthetic protein FlhB
MADQSKTEQPTQRRLQKAREEGQFPAAREFVSALQFMVFLGLLGAWGTTWFAEFRETARRLFVLAFTTELRSEDLTHLAWKLAWKHFSPLALGGLAVAVATLGFRLITTRFGVSLQRLVPDPARLNPLAKLRELPRQNLPMVLQSIVLLPVFLWAVYVIARDKLEAFLALPLESVTVGWNFLGVSLMELFWKAAGVFLLFGCVDLARQLRRYRQDLRMSKQDIKEEFKDIEGNPQMKARIRRLQRDRLRRSMMKEVPTATAVVVNPTHYAVAIRYQVESMAAPRVIAKGRNYLALRIRQRAIENQVPIIENPPLAQALYQTVEVGQEIPPHLYRAVAEILAYIYKLMHGRLPGQR